MATPKRKQPQTITFTKPAAKTFSIPKFSLPQSLDEYFHDLKLEVHASLIFLERFSDKDPILAKLIKTYNSKGQSKLQCSLDSLVKESGIETGDFRRLILSTIDYLCTDIADLKIKLTKPHLVEKSLQVAMDETHEDSQVERQWWMEFLGYKAMPKGQQLVNVNVAPVQNNTTTVQQAVVNGLPSFNNTLADSEALSKQAIKELKAQTEPKQLTSQPNMIDITLEEKEKENA